jgi:oligopeptidase B
VSKLTPPVARRAEKLLTKHGHTRNDPYYWMRDREDPALLDYLKAENDYTEAVMAPTLPLQEELFQEFKARIRQTDESVPYLYNGYYYYDRVEDEKDYPLFCRKQGSVTAPERLLLDVNILAEGNDYCSAVAPEVTLDNRIMAYGVDFTGRRFYDIHFRAVDSAEDLPDHLQNTTGNFAWANDNRTLFYTRQHPETLRSHQVWRHTLGTPAAEDVLIFDETDETYDVEIDKTKSEEYLFIASSHTLADEYQFLRADSPHGEFQMLNPRRRDHEYDAEQFGDHFYIRTNLSAKNFRLMKTPIATPGVENWTEVLPHRDDVFFEAFEIFRDYLVVEERHRGLLQLRVIPWDGSPEHYIDFDEPAYDVFTADNHEFDTTLLRFHYSSLRTPDSVYDYDMAARQRTLLKRDEVLAGFAIENYTTERLDVPARDGTLIPISLVYRNDRFAKDSTNPLLLLGYGSYGISEDADFSPFFVSLLDRGFVFAIAHIRGGQELGRHWYEDGKLLKKKNTFTDFIDCAEHLIATGYADPHRVCATGGSAGGLLMGAVANMRPELWRAIFAAVPFVDVVTTMLDSDIPLTTSEYDEWGDPNKQEFYNYILGYSPYDNVSRQQYPALLIQSGLHDSQVQYWEPTKWIARLRTLNTSPHPVLLKTELDAGHSGVSGRDKGYREKAEIYAFLIAQVT